MQVLARYVHCQLVAIISDIRPLAQHCQLCSNDWNYHMFSLNKSITADIQLISNTDH